MDMNILITTVAVVVAILLGIAGIKMVKRRFEKEDLEEKWKEARQKVEEKGYKLDLVSEKRAHARNHPMPRSGMIYASGGYLRVRYEHREPQDVLEFLEKIIKERRQR